MSTIYPGRYTVEADRDFVVFVIGARVNRWWLFHKWIPVARAMSKMLRKLQQDRNLGMLSRETFFRLFPLTTLMVSYWESFEHLERFASDKSLPHVEEWAHYMRNIGNDGSVGIYHETYKVSRNGFECIYGNMPRFGLASAFRHVSIKEHQESARERISTQDPA